MLPDELMIVRNVPMGENIRLMPLSDVHVGSKEFDEVLFREWKDSLKPTDLVVIVGDMINNSIKSSVGNIYEETMMPSAQKEWIYNELKDIAPQILCAVGGNHERRSVREVDDDPLYAVMCRLKREDVYRSGACFCKVRFGGGTDRTKITSRNRPVYNIAVLHGASNGMYMSTSGAKTERFAMSIANCDLLISGHTHKPLSFFPSHIYFPDTNIPHMSKRQTTVVICSSMMNRIGGYALEKMLPATANVQQEILLTANGKGIKVTQSMGGE